VFRAGSQPPNWLFPNVALNSKSDILRFKN